MKLEFKDVEKIMENFFGCYELEEGDSMVFIAHHKGECILNMKGSNRYGLSATIATFLYQHPEMMDIFKDAVAAVEYANKEKNKN